MPRRGSASTMCNSRGAAVASRVRVTWARSASSVGGEQPSAHHDRGDHPLAQPVVGKTEDRAVADGGMGAQRGLDRLRQHGQPARADRVVGAAQHAQHARLVDGAEVVGAEPARLGERVGVDRVAVALGQRRATEHDAAVGRHPHLHAVQRDAVVDAAARRSRSSRRCGPPRCRPPPRRRAPAVRGRAAAEQHGVQFGERGRGRRVGQRLGQLRGDQRRVAPAGPQSPYRAGQFGDIEARRRRPARRAPSRRARCAPAPAARRCDTAATPAASCPVRRDGHGWPPRWRSARRRSAGRPWARPWFPTSSPPGQCRRRCLRPTRRPPAAHPRRRRRRAATSAGSRPSSTRSRAGNSDETAEPGGTVSARRTAMRGPRPSSRVVERPALGRQPRPYPLDVLLRRQLVGELRDQHADVDVVELAALDQLVGHVFDLVVGQPAGQQREHGEGVASVERLPDIPRAATRRSS